MELQKQHQLTGRMGTKPRPPALERSSIQDELRRPQNKTFVTFILFLVLWETQLTNVTIFRLEQASFKDVCVLCSFILVHYQKQLLCCSVPMLIHPLVWCSAPLTRRSSPALTLLCTPTHTFVYISAEAFSRCVWQHNQCVSLKVWPKCFVMSEGHRWCWNRLCNMMRRISQTQSPERDSFLPGHMDQH